MKKRQPFGVEKRDRAYHVVAYDRDKIGGYKWFATVATFKGAGANAAAKTAVEVLNAAMAGLRETKVLR